MSCVAVVGVSLPSLHRSDRRCHCEPRFQHLARPCPADHRHQTDLAHRADAASPVIEPVTGSPTMMIPTVRLTLAVVSAATIPDGGDPRTLAQDRVREWKGSSGRQGHTAGRLR